jgi:hypothetical protein
MPTCLLVPSDIDVDSRDENQLVKIVTRTYKTALVTRDGFLQKSA